jgi:hypothetical protein
MNNISTYIKIVPLLSFSPLSSAIKEVFALENFDLVRIFPRTAVQSWKIRTELEKFSEMAKIWENHELSDFPFIACYTP